MRRKKIIKLLKDEICEKVNQIDDSKRHGFIKEAIYLEQKKDLLDMALRIMEYIGKGD